MQETIFYVAAGETLGSMCDIKGKLKREELILKFPCVITATLVASFYLHRVFLDVVHTFIYSNRNVNGIANRPSVSVKSSFCIVVFPASKI